MDQVVILCPSLATAAGNHLHALRITRAGSSDRWGQAYLLQAGPPAVTTGHTDASGAMSRGASL